MDEEPVNYRPEDVTALWIKDEFKKLQATAELTFKGRPVRFVGSFNGQPHGRSKKSLAGKEAVITGVYLCLRNGVTFHSTEPEWISAGFELKDVEFL